MRKLLLAFALLPSAAFAQQPAADPAFLQRALAVLQAQRNQAMDAAASQQARADGLSDELAKAQARLKELEPKKDEAPKQ